MLRAVTGSFTRELTTRNMKEIFIQVGSAVYEKHWVKAEPDKVRGFVVDGNELAPMMEFTEMRERTSLLGCLAVSSPSVRGLSSI